MHVVKSALFWWLNERFKNDRISIFFFSVLHRDLIRRQRALLKKFYPSASRHLSLYLTSWGRNKRLIIGGEFHVDMASIARRPNYDQNVEGDSIVDALTPGRQPTLDAFLRRQEEDLDLPHWGKQYSTRRVGEVSRLLEADEQSFVLLVYFETGGLLRILDGHHRFRIKEIRGSQTVRVLVGIGKGVDSAKPLISFLHQFRKSPPRV